MRRFQFVVVVVVLAFLVGVRAQLNCSIAYTTYVQQCTGCVYNPAAPFNLPPPFSNFTQTIAALEALVAQLQANITQLQSDILLLEEDYGNCENALTTCDASLSTCNTNYGVCQSQLAICMANSSESLQICLASLGNCTLDWMNTNNTLLACYATYNATEGYLLGNVTELNNCTLNEGYLLGNLTQTNNSLVSCQGLLGACDTSIANNASALTTCQTTLALTNASLIQ